MTLASQTPLRASTTGYATPPPHPAIARSMQSHIPAALGGRPSPFVDPLHAAHPSSMSSPFAQPPLSHSPFAQGSGVASSAASRAISPHLSNGSTPAGARSPLSGTRSPTMPSARPDHFGAPSISAATAAALSATAPALSVGGSVTPSNDDIEAVIQLAMASSPAGSANGRDTRTQLFVGNVSVHCHHTLLAMMLHRSCAALLADVPASPESGECMRVRKSFRLVRSALAVRRQLD